MTVGSVISSHAMLALRISPPDNPGDHIPPIAEKHTSLAVNTHAHNDTYTAVLTAQ